MSQQQIFQCGRRYCDIYTYHKHQRKCKYCNYTCYSKLQMEEHSVRDKCPMYKYFTICRYCSQQIENEKLNEHTINCVETSETSCKHCWKKITYSKVKAHESECQKELIQCKECKEDGIQRSLMKQHLSTICSKYFRKCDECDTLVTIEKFEKYHNYGFWQHDQDYDLDTDESHLINSVICLRRQVQNQKDQIEILTENIKFLTNQVNSLSSQRQSKHETEIEITY